jgi:Spy/CpxP family protein refolding chaperone
MITDSNKKYRALIFIIIFLLATNIVMLILLMSQDPPNKDEHDSGQSRLSVMLKNEVGFSETQLQQYQAFRNAQQQNVKPLFENIRKLKQNFYDQLSREVSDSALNQSASQIGELQKQIDLQMFTYFKNIRNICTPAQLPKYDSAIQQVVTRMINKPSKGKSSHK